MCRFLDDEEKLVVACGNKVGLRSTNGEQIFLNTILQVDAVPQVGTVTVELDIVKASFYLTYPLFWDVLEISYLHGSKL